MYGDCLDHLILILCSVKAGAAHIAFAASSRNAVLEFFTAALKAGGRIHGEPAIRDPGSGYFSAAVLDFDNNSIEVRHREGAKAKPWRQTTEGMENQSVMNWQKDVARSTASNSPAAKSDLSQVIINNLTTPTMIISQPTPNPKPKSDMNARTLVGTLFGAAAGSAVAYAMTKAEDESQRTVVSRTKPQATETPIIQPTFSALGHPGTNARPTGHSMQHPIVQQIEYPHHSGTNLSHALSRKEGPTSQMSATPVHPGTLIETFIPPSEVARYPPRSLARSLTDSIIQPPRSPAISTISRPAPPSRASSAAKTVTPAHHPATPPSVVTEVRLARDMPLPTSRPASVVRDGIHAYSQSLLDSVAPSDSISQAGSKKSHGSRRSKRHSSTSDRSRRSKAGDS